MRAVGSHRILKNFVTEPSSSMCVKVVRSGEYVTDNGKVFHSMVNCFGLDRTNM